ncbi:MAG: 3-ketoacyl-ACP reductase [Porticoccaceae bacterium]|nr:MAG: 3-ketoacyl-ACP reductase [Porticoccaceae bacterium]
MSSPLADRVVVVTGGFGNLGWGVGREAAARGARVALLDLAPEPPSGLEPPPGALLLGGVDITDPAAARSALEKVVATYGRLDVLLNIAGGFCWETFEEGDLESWDRMFRINLKTAVTATKAALPHLLAQGGSVVCVSAGPALKGDLGLGPYAAAKAGVARFVESLAAELKDRGVRVNAVLPSIIDTPQNRQAMPDADFARWVTPEQLARVILFLASDEADAVTGALVPVFNRV